jgi:hypothetical protein
MSALQAPAIEARPIQAPDEDEVEISSSAIAGYRWLLAAVGGTIHTHACGDGGLLCEKRTHRARPTIWRVAADGTVLPDSPYDYARRAFVTAALPAAPRPYPEATAEGRSARRPTLDRAAGYRETRSAGYRDRRVAQN